jgi:hypothetical protein
MDQRSSRSRSKKIWVLVDLVFGEPVPGYVPRLCDSLAVCGRLPVLLVRYFSVEW